MQEAGFSRQGIVKVAAALLVAALMTWSVVWACEAFNPEDPSAVQDLSFVQKHTDRGTVYFVLVPPGGSYEVVPALARRLDTLETFIHREQPLAAINGGFFDPVNGQAVSYVTLDGQTWDDPTKNERLTGNAGLKPYLSRFFNRSEFRQYRCNGDIHYDITPHDAPVPDHCTLASVLGGGPLMAPEYRAREEAFTDYDTQGRMIRDSIGTVRPNARSAVGITENGGVILGMAAMNPEESASGLTLEQMRDLMVEAGAVRVLSLDGGSSSGIHFKGNTYYGKFTDRGDPVKRPLRSVLLVQPRD